jgi:hypothetical protein
MQILMQMQSLLKKYKYEYAICSTKLKLLLLMQQNTTKNKILKIKAYSLQSFSSQLINKEYILFYISRGVAVLVSRRRG